MLKDWTNPLLQLKVVAVLCGRHCHPSPRQSPTTVLSTFILSGALLYQMVLVHLGGWLRRLRIIIIVVVVVAVVVVVVTCRKQLQYLHR